jgi:hypothetical protein
MKGVTFPDPVEMAVLNAAFDAGGAIAIEELRQSIPADRRRIWRAIYTQADLGNVKRHRDGQPVTLTASARSAIAAGRRMLADLQGSKAA